MRTNQLMSIMKTLCSVSYFTESLKLRAINSWPARRHNTDQRIYQDPSGRNSKQHAWAYIRQIDQWIAVLCENQLKYI